MINTERIVPVTVIDLLSLYGLILKVGGVSVTALDATSIEGAFEVEDAGTYLADQPVQSMDITANSATVYFVPALDYSGFTLNGVATTPTGDDVVADGRTLYKATLSSGSVAIETVGF